MPPMQAQMDFAKNYPMADPSHPKCDTYMRRALQGNHTFFLPRSAHGRDRTTSLCSTQRPPWLVQ